MNNTYSNSIGGINVAVGGTTATSFAAAINAANIYGVTANVSGGKINIIYSVPGPIKMVERDSVDTPLANAGISTSEFGSGVSSFVVPGTIANPTFGSNSYFGLGINWNAILNSMPQNERGPFKEIWIAQPERQDQNTAGFRPLNVWANTHSPQTGQPWQTANISLINFSGQEIPTGNINGTNTNFTLAHGTIDPITLTVVLNGTPLIINEQFTVSGGTNQNITFATAPPSKAQLFVYYAYGTPV